MTIYFAMCSECGAHGPGALTEADADEFAIKAYWTKVGDDYTCPEPEHARDKARRDFWQSVADFSEGKGNEAKKNEDPPAE